MLEISRPSDGLPSRMLLALASNCGIGLLIRDRISNWPLVTHTTHSTLYTKTNRHLIVQHVILSNDLQKPNLHIVESTLEKNQVKFREICCFSLGIFLEANTNEMTNLSERK